MAEKVVILGGGVAGMSAAHELVERGFEVEIYERQLLAGGKARSIPVFESTQDHGGKREHTEALKKFIEMRGYAFRIDEKRLWLPGEHGFRFFPNFYRHVVDTLGRIPFGSGTVADNLVDTTRILITEYDKPGLELPSRFPESAADIASVLKAFLYAISPRDEIPYAEIEHFAGCVWRIITSCEARRFEEYEKIGWWQFIGADERSEAYRKFLAIGITRSLVAARATTASTKTIGDIFVQLLFGILSPGTASDRLLNGPTNLVWIQPWLEHLQALGVRYNFGADVKAINCRGGRIVSATIETDGHRSEVTGDWFVAALPIERMAPLVTGAMVAADPSLANLAPLSDNVQWMNGIQFYLNRDVPVTHGHVIYIDSPWALTSVSQRQFWDIVRFEDWGDGNVRGILSVDISQWDTPGFNGKAAIDCSREQIAEEVWLQLKRSLNVGGQTVLRDEDLHFWFLDPDIVADPRDPRRMNDVEPLLVNRVNTWRLRPEAGTGIANLMLASDYVRTHTDLATMEGANEAARRAVNAILDRCGSPAPRATVWNLHEPELFAPLREYDRQRFEAGLPWDDRFPVAVEAALNLAQCTTGITAGGEGPLAAIAPITAAAATPGDTVPPIPVADDALGAAVGLARRMLAAADADRPETGAAAPPRPSRDGPPRTFVPARGRCGRVRMVQKS